MYFFLFYLQSFTTPFFFLQNMLNNVEKSGSGHQVIMQAFDSMTRIAQHINEMKRQHERAVHIQEIQSTLFGWHGNDLTTYGDLVIEVR